MRAFIALDIPFFPDIGRVQDSLKKERVKFVERENIHITLKFLGDIDEAMVDKIAEIVEECKTQPFTIRLKNIGFFPNEHYVRVIWIGVENGDSIIKMAKCIDSRLSKLGFKKEKSYVPHLTIARVKGRIDISKLESFRTHLFGEAEITEIKIKKSTLTPKGPIYEDIRVIQL